MKRRNVYFLLFFFSFVGLIAFFMLRPTPELMDPSTPQSEQEMQSFFVPPVSKTQNHSDDVWKDWIDAQIDLTIEEIFKRFREELPYVGPPEEAINVDDVRQQLRKVFESKADEFKKNNSEPPPLRLYEEDFTEPAGPKPHNGPQTVDALLASFEDMAADPLVDGKYPQAEWVAMLLDKGVRIEHFGQYSRYLTIRGNLISLENRPGEWTSRRYGIPPTEDWETYRSAYIDRKIWENQQIINAQKVDPTIDGGIFRGPDANTFLPLGGGRYYVKRLVKENGIVSASTYGGYMSSEDSYNLFVNGVEPKGYQIIYLDESDNILSEPPPVISDETFQEHVQDDIQSPEHQIEKIDPFEKQVPPDKVNTSLPREASPEEKAARAAQKMTERVKAELVSLGQVIKTEAEWQLLFEQSLIPMSEVPPLKQTEAILIEQYPERFDKAINLIHIHGPEEGLNRIRTVDPDIAVHIGNWFRAAYVQKKNASR